MNTELLLVARLLGVFACFAAAWLQGRARTGIGVGIAFCCCLLAMRMLGEEPSELIGWMALVPLFSLGAWGAIGDDPRFKGLAATFAVLVGLLVFCSATVAMIALGTETIRGEQQDAFVSLVPPGWAVLVCGLGALATGLPLVLPQPVPVEPASVVPDPEEDPPTR